MEHYQSTYDVTDVDLLLGDNSTYLHEKFCYPLLITTWDAKWQVIVQMGLQPRLVVLYRFLYCCRADFLQNHHKGGKGKPKTSECCRKEGVFKFAPKTLERSLQTLLF